MDSNRPRLLETVLAGVKPYVKFVVRANKKGLIARAEGNSGWVDVIHGRLLMPPGPRLAEVAVKAIRSFEPSEAEKAAWDFCATIDDFLTENPGSRREIERDSPSRSKALPYENWVFIDPIML